MPSIEDFPLEDGEEIRWIPGVEGYAVTSLGRVVSFNPRRRKPSRLGGSVMASGYRNVTIRGRSLYVHRLVASAFHGPPPEGCVVCHNNGDKSDNRAENLRWDTPAGNIRDQEKHGTRSKGVGRPASKLDPHKVQNIRRRYAAGEKIDAIAEDFGVSEGLVSDVARGKRWRHIPGPVPAGRR